MIVRVDVDNVAATVELDNEPWTLELVGTLLRMCGEEVVRTAIALGAQMGEGRGGDEDLPAL